MKTRLTLIFALLLLCLGTGAALASTPDGQTPAEETVCDSETGAAYGLCNAYCEAMDCDSDNPSASATACSRVQAKFQQITGRDLPCEVPQVTCPCADPDSSVGPEFAQVLSGQIAITSCSSTAPFFTGGIFAAISGGAKAYSGTRDGITWNCGFLPNPDMIITPEEGQACAQLLEQAANSQGVSCP